MITNGAIYKALEYAIRAHDGQYDKGNHPYILHPLQVSTMVDTDEEKIVALLHDVVEDTDCTLNDIAEALSRDFTANSYDTELIIHAVDCITKRKGEKYADYIKRVCSNWLSINVKIADMTHNCDVSRLDTDVQATGLLDRLRQKYGKWLPVLLEAKAARCPVYTKGAVCLFYKEQPCPSLRECPPEGEWR